MTLGIAILVKAPGEAKENAPAPVSKKVTVIAATARVERADLVVTVTEEGELRASKAQSISAPFNGKISKILPEGTRVNPGEAVIWMETTDIEDQIELRQAELDRVQAAYDKAVVTARLVSVQDGLDLQSKEAEKQYALVKLDSAKRAAQKAKILVENKLSPRSALEDAELQVNSAELYLKNTEIGLDKSQRNQTSNEKIQAAEIRKAEVDLHKAQQDMKRSQDELAKAVVITQEPGMIVHSKTWRGGGFGKVQEGDQVYRGQGLLELPDLTQVEVLLFVNEMDIFQVKEGQPAVVHLDALSDRTFKGAVSSIAALAQDMGQTKDFFGDRSGEGEGISAFEVRISLSEKDDRMRQGMSARVEVEVARVSDALLIPVESLFTEPDGETVVFVKKGLFTQKTSVRVGLSTDERVEISQGLSEGDEVLLSAPSESKSVPPPKPAEEER